LLLLWRSWRRCGCVSGGDTVLCHALILPKSPAMWRWMCGMVCVSLHGEPGAADVCCHCARAQPQRREAVLLPRL
jgi:hypothetical protein